MRTVYPDDPAPSELRARDRFQAAVTRRVQDGLTLPCQNPETRQRWTSEDPSELRWAATECVAGGCPLLAPCRDAGLWEDHGAWGGKVVQYTRRSSARRWAYQRRYRQAQVTNPDVVEPAAAHLLQWLGEVGPKKTTEATKPREGHTSVALRGALDLLEARGQVVTSKEGKGVLWSVTGPVQPTAPTRADRRARRRALRAKVRALKARPRG